jgi:DNA-binding response OmpR family regulator
MAAEPVRTTTGEKRMHRLLIAEDIPAVASHLEDLARDSGIDAIMIVDSIESARAVIEFAPEIAIIDLNLADGFTGPMIADELRRSCDTRIIYLTANPELLPEALHMEHRVLLSAIRSA